MKLRIRHLVLLTLICLSLIFSVHSKIISEESSEVCDGIMHIHRVTDDPMNINILLIDLKNPTISFKAVLAQDSCHETETVSSMAKRYNAIAGVNGDFWGPGGVPQGLMITDSEMVMSPRFRTALGITKDNEVKIGMWTDRWNWYGRIKTVDGKEFPIVFINNDCNPGWLCLYTDKWGAKSKGNTVSPVTEVLLNEEKVVKEIRTDKEGVEILKGCCILTGRDDAGKFLKENVKVGDKIELIYETKPDWKDLNQAISAGPRILKDGEFYQDSLKVFPDGEDFTLEHKENHYLKRHPRTAAGVTEDNRMLILIVVDGRQSEFSIGITLEEMADLLKEFRAYQALDLDSGGSSTMVIKGKVVNHPSDKANADGTAGVERSVANSLLIFCNGK